MSPRYQDDETLREARARYFESNGFGDGGYEDAWVRLAVGPLALYFPNSKARVRAVRFHDLHHVLTDYPTTWIGEAEIGAWEVASGCAHHYPAWILNLLAMAIGLILGPGQVRAAFARGRRSRNLYRDTFDAALLDQRLGHLRARLGLANEPTAAGEAGLPFLAWSLVGLSLLAASIALPWALLAGLLWCIQALISSA